MMRFTKPRLWCTTVTMKAVQHIVCFIFAAIFGPVMFGLVALLSGGLSLSFGLPGTVLLGVVCFASVYWVCWAKWEGKPLW